MNIYQLNNFAVLKSFEDRQYKITFPVNKNK